jgi:hypothetical protein
MSFSASAIIAEEIGDMNVKIDMRAAIVLHICRLRERGSADPWLSIQAKSADSSSIADTPELYFGVGILANNGA